MPTVRATIVQTPGPETVEFLPDRVVSFGDDGVIDSVVGPDVHRGDVSADCVLGPDHVLLPGMIDTHLHAPQWPQLGTGLDLPLEQWLAEYTFPLESRYADVDFAVSVWDSMVPTLLSHGTTTAVYYSSTHVAATTALAEACLSHGQRALVGRVAMDHPDTTPEHYRDRSASAAVAASAESVETIRALTDPLGLVEPIITPRFIPACTDASLEGLAELAVAADVRIQTHCSESDWEHRHVHSRCGRSDTRALDHFGLLRAHTVLAHATHLDDSDRAVIARRRAGIAHCPLSNVYFANRPFRARQALDAGIRVGLGTDIAGAPSPSLLGQCGHAVAASQRIVDDGDRSARIDARTAFWMATAGGAELLGIDSGILDVGKNFDAVAVSLPGAGVDDRLDGPERVFDKMVHRTSRSDITGVWVAGRRVVDRPAGLR